MYNSAWACRARACIAISAPPPRQNRNGATTTGRGQNLIAAVMRWNARTAKSTSSHSSSCALSSSCIRLAPTEKCSASPLITNASKFAHSAARGLQRLGDKTHDVFADRVLLRVQLEAGDAVAQIDQRAPGFPLTMPLAFCNT